MMEKCKLLLLSQNLNCLAQHPRNRWCTCTLCTIGNTAVLALDVTTWNSTITNSLMATKLSLYSSKKLLRQLK